MIDFHTVKYKDVALFAAAGVRTDYSAVLEFLRKIGGGVVADFQTSLNIARACLSVEYDHLKCALEEIGIPRTGVLFDDGGDIGSIHLVKHVILIES